MKKTLLALGAVILMGLVACDPDDDKPASQSGNPSSGEYNPAVKIASVGDDYDNIDRWNWDTNKVTSIDHYNGSQLVNSTTFTYDGNQLTRVNFPGSTSTGFTYADGKLTQVTMSHHDLPMPMTMAVSYTGNQISGLSMPISEAMVEELIGEMLGEVLDGGGMDFKGSKATGGSMQIDLTWSSDNVSRMVNTMNLTYDLPVDQLMNLASAMMGEEIAQYADLISGMLAGTSGVPLNLTIADTTDFTYDQNHNPKRGFMGGLDDPEALPELLSKNNIASYNQHGATSYRLELPTMMAGALAATMPQLASMLSNTMPHESDRENYTYEYNAKGYPVTITSSDGDVKRITYAE